VVGNINNIQVIDGRTNQVIASIAIQNPNPNRNGDVPFGVAVNPLTGNIYASGGNPDGKSGGDVWAVNGQTYQVTAVAIPSTSFTTYGIDVNPKTGNVYAATYSPSDGHGSILVINSRTNQITDNIRVDNSPTAVAVNPLNGFVYVVNTGGYNTPGNVAIIS
jgi:DNA-binding beta-propeller fold protein YncE